MFERVKNLFLEGRIDINGLGRAVQFKWVTEEDKTELIKVKSTTHNSETVNSQQVQPAVV